MPITEPRPSLDEIARLGRDKFVAIALGGADYAIEPTAHDAVVLIRTRNPSDEVFRESRVVHRADDNPTLIRREENAGREAIA